MTGSNTLTFRKEKSLVDGKSFEASTVATVTGTTAVSSKGVHPADALMSLTASILRVSKPQLEGISSRSMRMSLQPAKLKTRG